MARDAKTKLGKMRIKIEKLQEPWLDADPMIEQAVAKVLGSFDDLIKQLDDSVEYMNESMDS